MMDIRPIDKSEINKWEQYVASKPTIAWQTYYWSDVVKRHYDVEFLPVAAFEGNQISGIMPLYMVKTIKKKTDIISVPYAVGGGLSADNPDAEKALIDFAIALHADRQANRIIFKQYKHKLTGPFATDDNFYNRELDLTIGPDQLYRQFDDKNRLNKKPSYGRHADSCVRNRPPEPAA